ncbi:MAG: hypothetical protein EAZ53_14955 [Bacteroidetes bacterium]|nr:MAG: hypothetical protein EAZ53_14955 [Bacteroidota bacterium]
MANFVQKLLDIDSSEQSPVLLLLANSFCIGVFIVSYDVAASSIFLDTFGKEFLTILPIFSGITGMTFTYIFGYFQRKIKFTTLAMICFLLISLVAAIMFIGLEFYNIYYFKFLSYLFLGPINSLFILCFYGTVSRSFSLKREKHMTNTVDQGQMIATAISFFVVFFVSDYVQDIYKFFITSFLSGILAFVFMLWFVKAYHNKGNNASIRAVKSEKASVTEMIKTPYIRMVCMLFLASVVATIFLEFSFLNVTTQKYTDINDLARFLGVFGGLVTVVSFLMQTFVADWAIKNYGPKVSLILIPSILGVFALLASIIGTIFGYTAEAGSFILFFLFLAMSKMFLQSLKEAFEDPIVKALFIPLSSNTRYDIQTKVEGFFKEFSAFTAGILLTTLGFMKFFDLIFYSYFLVGICLAYFFIVISLFFEYRKVLTNTLIASKGNDEFLTSKDYEVTDVLKKELDKSSSSTRLYTLKLMEKLEPLLAKQKFIELINDDSNPEIRDYAIQRIQVNNTIEAIDQIKNIKNTHSDSLTKQLAEKALISLKETDSVEIVPNYTYSLVKSRRVEDRLMACYLLGKTDNDVYLPQIMLLLRDSEVRVRQEAILTCAKINKPETWAVLIEYLGSYTFTNTAASVLISFGEKVLPALEAAFYKTGQVEQIQEKIVQIYGRIGGDRVISLLWNKIDLPNKKIVNNVLLCLTNCGFKPQNDQITRIKSAIETDIGNSAWIVAAQTEIPENEFAKPLKIALEEEIEFNFENIYMLLALIYDPQAIKLVKENIESGNEGVVYAIELLDVFLAEDLKPILFPLFEDITQAERNERLQSFFPRQKLDKVEVLKQIINRDYNSINKWTKACALHAYGHLEEAPMCDDLTANLFNPDPLIREVAAWAIYSKNPASYHKNSGRLTELIKDELDYLLLPSIDHPKEHHYNRRIQKIFYLKSLEAFENVTGVILVEFIELISVVRFKKGEIILHSDANGDSPLYILVVGAASKININNEKIDDIANHELIGETLILEEDKNQFSVLAEEDCFLFKIDKDQFYEQIYDNFEIAKELIEVVSKKNKITTRFSVEAK